MRGGCFGRWVAHAPRVLVLAPSPKRISHFALKRVHAGEGAGISTRGACATQIFPHALGASVCRSARFHFHSSTATYHDVTYRFASAEHQAMFEKDSGKFEPQFGGYCAYGVAMGHTSPVKVDAFQIVDGRLLMQYDTGLRDTFNKDQKRNLQTADKIWPTLSASSK